MEVRVHNLPKDATIGDIETLFYSAGSIAGVEFTKEVV
jgi:hypothetical protein